MVSQVKSGEIFGLIRPEIDIHTLGMSTIGKLIEECGYKVEIGDAEIAKAVARISKLDNITYLRKWILTKGITRLGFSYRLDPKNAQSNFGKVIHLLKDNKLFANQGGSIIQVYFAGLPEACNLIKYEYNNSIPVFIGDETQFESLIKLGIPKQRIPSNITKSSKYDQELLDFGKTFIDNGYYKLFNKTDISNYSDYGTFKDSLVKRISNNRKINGLPLTRVHVGPYQSNYEEAKREFLSWLRELSKGGLLDIVSIGSSQLSQSNFGENWGDKPNGGGVPINSKKDLVDIFQASRPMLVRTYSATANIPKMAEIYEETINMAWHALSLWWFNKIDGRGPYSVLEGLNQHFQTLKIIAKYNKPFEPNIPHHFSFRGGDDYTYILSAYMAAVLAKKMGIKFFVLQTMLNTPKQTFGIQDLAKTRALLKLVRELEDRTFTVYHQPRAGLDYFSPDLNKAKIQLAAVSAMMDDIDHADEARPDIIHVVSYCEAVKLATPKYINESIRITLSALKEYRFLKANGKVDNMSRHDEVVNRTIHFYHETKHTLQMLEKRIPNLYSPEGFYEVFKRGVLIAPYLWECKDEFKEAIKWNTSFLDGGVYIKDINGKPLSPSKRLMEVLKE